MQKQLNRKNKLQTNFTQKQRSGSNKKLENKRKHLLSKPNIKKNSLGNYTQSCSTLYSQNISKQSILKVKPNNKPLTKKMSIQGTIQNIENQVQKGISLLQKQLTNFDMEDRYQNQQIRQQRKQKQWFNIIQKFKKQIQNKKLRELIDISQQGYRKTLFNKENHSLIQQSQQNCNNVKQNGCLDDVKSKPKLGEQKIGGKPNKNLKLNINIGNINKLEIKDYQDQFMSKIQEFSPSWRQMLEMQKKRTY